MKDDTTLMCSLMKLGNTVSAGVLTGGHVCLAAGMVLMLSWGGCTGKSDGKSDHPPQKAAQTQPVQKKKPVAGQRELSYEIPRFSLSEELAELEKCGEECDGVMRSMKSRLKNFTAKQRLAARDEILRIYREGDAPARLAAIRALGAFRLSGDWVDLVGEWLLEEKDGRVRAQMYRLLADIGGTRAVTIVAGALAGEKDFAAFTGAAESAYLLDMKEKSTLLQDAFPRLSGRRLSAVWIRLMKLAASRNLVDYFVKCRDRLDRLSGRCARALAQYRRQEDFLMLLGYLETGKLTDPFAVSALSLYAREKWFDRRKALDVCLSLAANPKIPLLTRETALGIVGEMGSREELAHLLRLSRTPDVADAAKRAQWRIRRRIGLPVLDPLPPLMAPWPRHQADSPSGNPAPAMTPPSAASADASGAGPSKASGPAVSR